jgi:large subunit ribosomal protein L4
METKIANIEAKIFIENLDPTLNRKKRAIGLIHRVYLTQLKNARKHTASTKTRSEVRGGGRKPWKQKGTGNARAGSTRSPLFVGGGVIFGPRPRIVSKKINKKERRLAILSALYLKKQQFVFTNETVFTDFNEVKTKNIMFMFKIYL